MNEFLSRLQLRARREPWNENVQLMAFTVQSEGGAPVARCIGEPVTFRKLAEGEEAVSHPATLNLTNESAQLLMDELWDCGLRPSEGTGSAGALAATQKHLEDMRKLVGHALKVKTGF